MLYTELCSCNAAYVTVQCNQNFYTLYAAAAVYHSIQVYNSIREVLTKCCNSAPLALKLVVETSCDCVMTTGCSGSTVL
jgi:hypothetical protein